MTQAQSWCSGPGLDGRALNCWEAATLPPAAGARAFRHLPGPLPSLDLSDAETDSRPPSPRERWPCPVPVTHPVCWIREPAPVPVDGRRVQQVHCKTGDRTASGPCDPPQPQQRHPWAREASSPQASRELRKPSSKRPLPQGGQEVAQEASSWSPAGHPEGAVHGQRSPLSSEEQLPPRSMGVAVAPVSRGVCEDGLTVSHTGVTVAFKPSRCDVRPPP